jgi:serine protease AprX
MRKNIFLLSLISLLSYSFLSAQSSQYFIQFKYKKSNFTLQNPSAYLSARALQRRAKQNIIIDSLDLPVVPFYIDSIKNHVSRITGITKWLNGAVVEVSDSSQLDYMLNNFWFVSNYTKVKDAEKSASTKSKFEKKIAANFNQNCCIDSFYNYASNQILMLHGDAIHQQGYFGQGMQIAILDAGFDNVQFNPPFQNLWQQNKILGFYNFVFQQDSVFTDAEHGAEVLSTMGMNLPNVFVGTSPQASFYLYETEDDYSENLVEEYYWSIGAEHADSIGADLINSSLGYNQFDFKPNNHSYSDLNGKTDPSAIAASTAGLKGILVCVAAGNEALDSWHFIGSPADADNILTVGAVDEYRNHAPFSSYGPTADGRIKPDVCAKGLNSTIIGSSNYIEFGSGTSFASPTMCGMAASLWSKYPDKTAKEIRDAIKESANLFSNPDDSFGYGIPDFKIADLILSDNKSTIFYSSVEPIIFPNPATNQCSIFFHSNKSQQGFVYLYDVSGRQILTNNFWTYENVYDTFNWGDTKNIERGVYFVRLFLNDEWRVLKFVKQ